MGKTIARLVALLFAVSLGRAVARTSFHGSPLASIVLVALFAGLAILFVGAVELLLNPKIDPKRREFLNARLQHLDGPHRAFTVAAALWAVVAPLVAETERCPTGTVMAWVAHNLTGSCYADGTSLLTVVVVSALPPLAAYVALFFVAPPVLRWVRAGYDQGEKP